MVIRLLLDVMMMLELNLDCMCHFLLFLSKFEIILARTYTSIGECTNRGQAPDDLIFNYYKGCKVMCVCVCMYVCMCK